MSSNNISNEDLNNYLKDSDIKKIILDYDKIPKDILISTMTITCKLGTNINLENVAKYIDLNLDGIISIKYGCLTEYSELTRSLIEKKKKKKKGKKKSNFFNQATMEIKPNDNKAINVKLFKNGSIQMTGCKSIKNAYEILVILINNLKVEKAVIIDDEIVEKKYITNIEDIKIFDFKVVMINSNFTVNYSIDREQLYNILKKEGVTCTYEPCIHACVNIKFNCKSDNKQISIFVFQSGAIIITGANNTTHILSAYDYITKKLKENYSNIIKKKLDILIKNNKNLKNYMKINSLKFNKNLYQINNLDNKV
jgi:TATA-box binding protein (TBP) (component of TFIID and TFIIIB)